MPKKPPITDTPDFGEPLTPVEVPPMTEDTVTNVPDPAPAPTASAPEAPAPDSFAGTTWPASFPPS